MREVLTEAKDKIRQDSKQLHSLTASLLGTRAATTDDLASLKGYEHDDELPGPEVFTFVVTNGQRDRQAEIVDPNGWSFDSYAQNPVILDGHQSGSITDILGRGLPPLRRVGDEWHLDVVLSGCDKGRLARRLIMEGALRTVSVGFVSKRRERGEDGVLIHRDVELLEVSLVPIPANPAAQLVGVRASKAAIPAQELPVDLQAAWDGAAAEQAVRVWASSDGSGNPATIDWSRYRQAFLWVDESQPELLGSYKLGVATVRDGELVLVAAGVAAAAAALGGARGGVDIPAADRQAVASSLDEYRQQVEAARADAEGVQTEQDGMGYQDQTSKAGRVISRQNEDVIRQARDMAMGLVEALDQLLAQVPGEMPQVEPAEEYPPELESDGVVKQQRELHNELALLLRAVMEG